MKTIFLCEVVAYHVVNGWLLAFKNLYKRKPGFIKSPVYTYIMYTKNKIKNKLNHVSEKHENVTKMTRNIKEKQ
jgi:hypothetical protein